MDKYSKIEEIIKKNHGRKVFLDSLVLEFFGDLKNFFEYSLENPKDDGYGVRVNFLKFICKKSTVKFLLKQKQEDFEKRFLDEYGEKLVVRIK